MTAPAIREGRPGERARLMSLYGAAFPAEDLRPLLGDIVDAAGPGGPVLSLVAVCGDEVAGHLALSRCAVAGCPASLALLGPVAVAPARQGHGVGRALIEAGLGRLRADNVAAVHVLGDPSFYARFGFETETGVLPPCPVPDAWRDAWQVHRLRPDGAPGSGILEVPAFWRRPALWAP